MQVGEAGSSREEELVRREKVRRVSREDKRTVAAQIVTQMLDQRGAKGGS